MNKGGGQAMHEELRNMHMKWVTHIPEVYRSRSVGVDSDRSLNDFQK